MDAHITVMPLEPALVTGAVTPLKTLRAHKLSAADNTLLQKGLK